MTDDDAFAVLGLARGASAGELRAARRRLAKDLHPDRAGGDAEAMRRLNAALDAALAAQPRAGRESGGQDHQFRDQDEGWRPRPGGRVAHDVASFTIEALPAEAFEALLVVTSWIGEVVVDDPPYLLETRIEDPESCWCRLDLVPDAGSTTVSLTVVTDAGAVAPELDDVRDLWVANLNQLGRP